MFRPKKLKNKPEISKDQKIAVLQSGLNGLRKTRSEHACDISMPIKNKTDSKQTKLSFK